MSNPLKSMDQRFPDLRSFLDQLRREKDLVQIDAPVDPVFEAAEIHRRVIAAGGPALLFTNVKNSSFPLVTNLFGTSRRAELAFGNRPLQTIRRLVDLAQDLFPLSLGKVWQHRDLAAQLLRVGIRNVRSAPVAEVVDEGVSLDKLPALTCWSEDGGPFITLPLVYTEHPDGRGHNLGMYRMQVHSRNTTGMHWQIGKGGGFHYAAAEAKGQSLPVTVFLGGPPALTLAAIAPLPENVPELILASLICGERIGLLEGLGSHALVAKAEFALIGEVPPFERHAEGPFGDHYGYYSLEHEYPVFQVKRIARRRDAIFPATVVGKPRQEDFFIGDLLQELLLPLIPMAMPSVEDLWSYGETGYHSLAAARVRQRYKKEAIAAAFRILGEGQLSLTKFLFVTDTPVDLRDFRATLQHILGRTRTETDLFVFSNLAMDTLDYTGPAVNEGSKGVWLGLGDPVRDLPESFQWSGDLPADLTEVEVFCPGCLVLGTSASCGDHKSVQRIVSHPAFCDWPLLVLSDTPRRTAVSAMNFLWTVFTRFEPAADIYSRSSSVERNHIAYEAPILLDARLKPGFPSELFCSEPIHCQVSERWTEYFPGGLEMGDSATAHLD